MALPKSPNDKRSANASINALANSKPPVELISIPRGGALYNKTKKLREKGILLPNQTIEEYNQALLNEAADSDSKDEQNNFDSLPVEIEIESQADNKPSGFGGLLSRASQALRNDDSPKQSQSKKITQKGREDFSVLVVSVVTLLVAVAKVRESVKPNSDEINLFSDHMSGILLRHLPISSKMSADAVDIIGIVAVTATWYSRVHEDLNPRLATETKQERAEAIQPNPVRANGHRPTPIEHASPETSLWLNNIAARSEGLS